jgi:biopolymer transport protein ExbD
MAAAVSFGDEDDGRVMSDINVTPMVDVVLVLLIVFMITVPAIIGSTPIRVDLPQTSAAFDPSAEQLPLNISLKREGNEIAVYWNSDRIRNDEEFRSRLRQSRPAKDQEVSISADKDIIYDRVVHVMDLLAEVGVHKISLPTTHVAK